MRLAGQDRKREQGYALAVLLVGIAVMSILLTEAMPVWHQEVQREKEAELIFRGEQYCHAIILFQHKYGPVLPPNVDVLVQQKFLRRKYKDPMTGRDFQPIYQAMATQPGAMPGAVPGGTPGGATGAPGGLDSTTGGVTGAPASGVGTPQQPGTIGTGAQGGLIGVVSTSKATSIRIYNGYDHYNQWAFIYTQFTPKAAPGAQPGAGQPGAGRPTTAGPGLPPMQPPQIPGGTGVGLR